LNDKAATVGGGDGDAGGRPALQSFFKTNASVLCPRDGGTLRSAAFPASRLSDPA
jgi:hypothetical protein